jgi:hypothetical protein
MHSDEEHPIDYASMLEHACRREQMSTKKVIGIILFIGAAIVLVGAGFGLFAGHMKTGLGLLVLGVIALAVGLFAFFSSTTEDNQPSREWTR